MHGGDIYRNRVELDFSVNVNPLGIPDSVKTELHEAVEDCTCYPDIRCEQLKQAIGRMMGTDEKYILCANGASEIFPAVVRAAGHGARKVLIPTPSFSGYERAAKACGREIFYYDMKRENHFCLDRGILEALTEEVGILLLANPNNPVGNLIEQGLLEAILKRCRERRIMAVLDECFLEFSFAWKTASFLRRIEEFPKLVIVRSFTKIFAVPGVRLGYLACGDLSLLEEIAKQLPEWNLSVFAQRAGVAAAMEKEYPEEGRNLVKTEREYLVRELQALGFTVYPGEVNYLLFYSEYPVAKELSERGILIRDCSDYRGLGCGYCRIAVKKREDNERLLAAMREIVCR